MSMQGPIGPASRESLGLTGSIAEKSRSAALLGNVTAIGAIIGLNVAVKRSHGLALVFLFALGLLLGMAIGPVVNVYLQTNPTVVYQSAAATALFIGAFGSYGYATRRDLSGWARGLFWMLLALIGFGIVMIFINIPGGQLIYSILGLGIFAAYTMFDFNRLKRAGQQSAIPLAASIFLDIFNVFLFFLQIFGGSSR
ncbi:MAG: Bax inhibitor-1 family protein [Solirubrobacterales bacterium]|nr:Bax inhibitor-1 family protein [Solirubrobacterales bacterium]